MLHVLQLLFFCFSVSCIVALVFDLEEGGGGSQLKSSAAETARAGLRHAVVCSNVTGRTKERIAQSKRACAGSLALVD